ncbi:hypothetical protein [Spiroplasma poulsonii]|uniref:hypothetical protein n=1 Tax=Spiroplasma poulsonii TaxID=2138 RepID=UPI001F4C7BE4|nr:hypothetical protein [Spiroplasma poulsonii]UNF61701.1 hypothetical protein MNU24_07260 [Spiroplasma poulsonii]
MIILMMFIIIDATETPIQRPKKDKNNLICKKEKHTIKTQVIIEQETKNYCNKFFALSLSYVFI